MDNLELLRPFFGFLLSFFGTIYVIPHSSRKLIEQGHIAKDMYKKVKVDIPTNAGLILLFVTFISILVTPVLFRLISLIIGYEGEMDYSNMNLVMILVVTIFALYGLIDDLVDVGRKLKVALPIFFTLPLVYSMSFNLINIPLFGEISFSEEIYLFTVEDIFRFLVIPLFT